MNGIEQQMILDWQLDIKTRFARSTGVRSVYILKSIFDLSARLKWKPSSPGPKAERERFELKAECTLYLSDTKNVDALKASGKRDELILLLMLYANASKSVIMKARWEDILLVERIFPHRAANETVLRSPIAPRN